MDRRALVALALAFCLSLPTMTFAQASPDVAAAKAAFTAAREHYLEQRYAQAIEEFQRAYALAPNARLHVYIAQAYANLYKYPEAIASYEAYGATSAEAAAEVAAEIEALREEGRKYSYFEAGNRIGDAVARAAGGQPKPRSMTRFELGTNMRDVPVMVRSEPRGANVYVDEVELGAVGTTPLELRLFTGRHLITVERPHYEPERRVVTIAPPRGGESIPVFEFKLQRMEVEVELQVEPSTATVSFIAEDGQRRTLGTGNFRGRLPAGPGTFILQQAGKDRRIDHTVARGEGDGPVRIELSLSETPNRGTHRAIEVGKLKVSARVLDGDVRVDGRSIGRSPGDFEVNVTPGFHTVEIVMSGYRPWVESVQIAAGGELQIVSPESLTRREGPTTWPAWLLVGTGVGMAGGGGYLMATDSDSGALGYGLAGAGGAALIGGVVWLLVAGGDDDEDETEAGAGWRVLAAPSAGGAWFGFANEF